MLVSKIPGITSSNIFCIFSFEISLVDILYLLNTFLSTSLKISTLNVFCFGGAVIGGWSKESSNRISDGSIDN